MNSMSTPSPSLPSRIASLAHAHFNALPKRSKPTVYPDGSREWIPMTGIVVVKGENTPSESLTCIAVTSGAKCLSASHIPRCRGLVLHDFHAEILALRAFNYWLLTECHGILMREMEKHVASNPSSQAPSSSYSDQSSDSPFVRRRMKTTPEQNDTQTPTISWPPLELQPDVKVYMYCTCAPCGDASMELCMAAQEDATPWEVSRPPGSEVAEAGPGGGESAITEYLLDGRAHFSRLGVVRRKPSRMDAESTRSKSCSDKLALRQVSSLLSCETSFLVALTENAYLAGLILPEDEISHVACERAFGETGRMHALVNRFWPVGSAEGEGDTTGYQFRPFKILSVPVAEVEALWQFAKPKPIMARPVSHQEQQGDCGGDGDGGISTPPRKCKPGNVCAVWTAAPTYSHPSAVVGDSDSKSLPHLCRSKTGLYETIIMGVRQGHKATTPMARGASSLSRAKLWGLLRGIILSSPACEACQHKVHDQYADEDETTLPWCSPIEEHVRVATTYREFKRAGTDSNDPLRVRAEVVRTAKAVLKGWIPNAGDDSWGLEVLLDPKKRKR